MVYVWTSVFSFNKVKKQCKKKIALHIKVFSLMSISESYYYLSSFVLFVMSKESLNERFLNRNFERIYRCCVWGKVATCNFLLSTSKSCRKRSCSLTLGSQMTILLPLTRHNAALL